MPINMCFDDIILASEHLAAHAIDHTDEFLFLFSHPDSPICDVVDLESLRASDRLVSIRPADIRFSGTWVHLHSLLSGYICTALQIGDR